jgi:4'-phosphopantetheinyl transferase EntD
MTAAFRQAAVEAALATLFPPGVAVTAERIVRGRDNSLWPAEARAIVGAVPARRAEFAAGRAAARRALLAVGVRPVAIPASLDRAPVWPEGIGGSIAHAAGVAVAAVRLGGPLGIDIEEDAALEPALWPVICAPDELALLPEVDRGRFVRHVFSAKEAAYKAQFPLTESLFGFTSLGIRLTEGGFVARFRHAVGRLAAGHEMQGRLVLAQGLVLTGVAI